MILISTLPLKDLSSGFKESSIGSIADSRRAEMLQQANTLDERESFSFPSPSCLAKRALLYSAHHV